MTTATKTRRKKLHPQFLTDEQGKRTSVLLPVREFEEMLELIEDQEDIEDADKALAEPGESIPWEKVKAELGI